jgi:hypothetical protein
VKVDNSFISLLKNYFVTRLGDTTVGGNVLPAVTATHDLGSQNKKFATIYAGTVIADTLQGAGGSADKVDGFHAFSTPNASSLLALDANSLFPAITITLATTSGLQADASGLRLNDTVAGNGLTIASKILSVGAGNGISVSADAVAVNLASPAGLSFSGTGLQLDDAVAGNGLTIASKVLSVGAGTLITVAANTVGLSNGTAQYQVPVTGVTPFTPAWAALSTFAGNGLQFSAGAFTEKLPTNSGLVVDSNGIYMGTPASVTSSSANGVTTSSHTHAVDSTIARSAITITAGNGLSGGGDLTTNRTLDVGAGTLITVAADAVGVSNGTAQYQVPVTGASPFTPSYAALSTFAGNGLQFSSGAFTEKLPTNPGLVVDSTGIYLGTPASVTSSSSNGVTTSSHTHTIDSTIARSAISISAGNGLTGGGDLTANRSLAVLLDTNPGLAVSSTGLVMGTPTSVTATSVNGVTGAGHTHTADATLARSAITITAGNGLTGGGDLTVNRTLDVGAGTLITVAADTVGVSNGSAQYQVPVTGASPFTPAYAALSTFAGNGLQFSSGAFSNKLPTNSGLVVDANGIYLGTPASATSTSTNSVTTSSHTHAIDSTIARSAITITAGNGLIGGGDLTANRTLDVGAGTLITVNADDVALSNGTAQYQIPMTGATPFTPTYTALSSLAGSGLQFGTIFSVKRPTNSGLVADGTGLYLGTPSTLTVTSTNGVVTTAHSHAITSSADVGTTPAQSLLASTASGGLTLAALSVMGSVTVTTGGDFTVGANILFVDTSQSNIGINRAPDTQFDLDVNGSFRAGGYIVGKHALQIADAVMIAHFDGPTPYATNLDGNATGHMGQIATISGGVIFQQGNFGKAVLIDRAATNLIPNPRFEVDTTGWLLGGTLGTMERVTTDAYIGTACLHLNDTAGGTNKSAFIPQGNIAVTAGTSYTLSMFIKSSLASGNPFFKIIWFDSSNGVISQNMLTCTGTNSLVWTPFYITAVAPTNAVHAGVYITYDAAGAGDIWVDAVQLEATAYRTAYLDGSLGRTGIAAVSTGYSWAGTAHNSASSRAMGKLSYADIPLPNPAGAVSFWVMVPTDMTTPTRSYRYFFRLGSTSSAWAYISNTGTLGYGVGGTATYPGTVLTNTNFAPWTWHHIVVTWDANATTKKYLYLDGALWSSSATALTFAPDTGLYIGNTSSWAYPATAWFDDFAVIGHYMTASEVRSIYESNAPIFAETSTWTFRTPNNLTWGDSEGLWAIDATGNAAFGVSGVDGKSWGGVSLDAGDVLIGKSTSYVKWDNSTSTLSVSGTVTAGAGSIGGWTINTGYLAKDTGTDNTSSGMSPTDYPFYAGKTYTNRATAPFRVTPAGALVASSATITGAITATSGELDSLSVKGTLDVSTGGVIKSGATAYNTGTGFWIEYNAGTPRFYIGAAAGNKLTWDGTTLTIVGDGSGVTSINGGNIQTGTITATQIHSGTITADRMNVTSLSAIVADMGSITAGSIVIGSTNKLWLNDSADGGLSIGGSTKASAPFRVSATGALTATSATITGAITATSGELDSLSVKGTLDVSTGGVIKSGATAYNTGTGFWIDYNTGTPRFFIGAAAGNKLTWDGSTLTIVGEGSGVTNIAGGNIQTGTITATQIHASTITADRMNVTTLSAIAANMGSITAGSIVIGSTNMMWLNDSADGSLYIGGSTKVSAPFQVSAAGALTATNATITGAITATSGSFTGSITSTSGTIGGWTIGATLSATNLVLTPGAANVANILAGTGATAGGINAANASGDVVFWAGSTFANRATAAFRVTAGGALTATSGAVGGWTLGSGSLSSTNITLSKTNQMISIQTATFGSAGVQLAYLSSKGQLYAGDGGTNYVKFDGTNLTWSGISTSLDATGKFTASNVDLSGKITASSGSLAGLSISGVLTIGTSGSIVSGNTTIDINGISLSNGVAGSSAITWDHAYIYDHDTSSANSELYISSSEAGTGGAGQIVLNVYSGSNFCDLIVSSDCIWTNSSPAGQADIRVDGGLYIGSNLIDPVAGTITATGQITAGSFLEAAEIAAPATPGSGFHRIYGKTDGFLYTLNDAGIERVVAAEGTWTPTFTGFVSGSEPAGGIYRYIIVGKMCTIFVHMPNTGTSDASTSFSMTAPFTSKTVSGAYWGVTCWTTVDNNVAQSYPARAYISSNSSTITLTKTVAGAGWTASGAKKVSFTLTFELP